MKRLYALTVVSFLLSFTASAQTYGNEWIVYSQRYLKIPIAQDGIYRIDSTTLSNAMSAAGVSLSTVDARNLQLFHNGQEEYIWVEGESDGVFNSSDYLEFYGKKNDGMPDTELYHGITKLLNPYYSLYNDTSIYFLTWNSSVTNRRLADGTDTTFSSYAAAQYFTDEEIMPGPYGFLPGIENSLGMSDPDFIPSEGFYAGTFDYGQSFAYPLNSRNAYTLGPDSAEIRMKIGSHSDDWNVPNDNHVRIQFLTTTFDTIYNGYQVAKYFFRVPPSTLNSNSTTFTVSSINSANAASSGRTALAYLTLTYPHTFDLEGRTRFNGSLQDNPSGSKYFMPIKNVGGSGPVRVYDLFHHQRITTVYDNSTSTWQALMMNGNGTKKPFVVYAESNVIPVSTLVPVNNGSGVFNDFSQQAADSVFIIVANKRFWSTATNYKTYRSGPGGGMHNVVLADVSELYDQFAWGIAQDPLSIRHFANFMVNTFPSPPRQLLLIGKSVYPESARTWDYASNLVPTFGYPPCDNSYTSGLNGTGWENGIPTGRISALTDAQAQWYLDKVIAYESQQPAEWMKYVLHFGGGTSVYEQSAYASYLQGFANTIQDTSFGAIVQSYLKTSSAPIQINQSDSLRQRIESGVSIMTFFGHASGTGFDQSIDDPTTYNNVNRYPFLIANSCYAGDIHSDGVSSSEAFTLLDQKGTIGYLASVGVGVAPYLNEYTSRLYRAIGQTKYGEPVGDCIKWAVNNAQHPILSDTFMLKVTCMEMTLEGDPAVVINSFKKPDYEITNADVWIDQETQPDSVTIFAKMTNTGKAVRDSFFVELKRTFPNGDSITYLKRVRAPFFRDTVVFTIPVDQQRGIGLNKIRITLDHFGQISELDENNNSTTPDIDLLIRGSAIVPIYPYDFAVIPSDTVTLKASTVNPLEPVKTYRFEMDTTDLFNSPFKLTYVVTAAGGVVSWKPNITFTDSTVYFWRVSPDSTSAANPFYWRQTSFQYITGQVGWGQDHIYQFTNDGYQFIRLDRTARQFEFVNDVKALSVHMGMYKWTNFDAVGLMWNDVYYKINGTTEHIFSCVPAVGRNGLSIAVIDPLTAIPWSYYDDTAQVEPGGYYDCVGGNQVLNAFDFFDDNSADQDKIANFIDSIPTGSHVLIYSQDYNWYTRPAYNSNLTAALQTIGSVLVAQNSVSDTVPYLIWGTKGGPLDTEMVGTSRSSVLTLQDTLTTNWNSGTIASPIIGPAQSWGSFHWRQHGLETPDYDSIYVELYGITPSGTETFVTRFNYLTTDVLNLNSIVNASQYPYIRLVAKMDDDTDRTPPQIDRWHVLYTPYPDAAVNPPIAYSMYNDTLQEGDNVRLVVGVQNVTPWAFNDSLLLTYWLVDRNRVRHNLPQKLKAPPFNGYSWFPDTVKVNTAGYPGANELWMEVNPVGNVNSQLEQHHFNNVLMVPFNVTTDKINPLLDVTFDGVHIMDGDIVSAKPSVLVTLKDENQFLALNDTSDFQVFLRTPSQQVAQLVPWGPNMIFTPAVLPNNSAKILFTPACHEDGIYEFIVQAKDRSNNQSGLIDYRITFDVINKPTITNVMNYPNPFSTSTQFVFTLTGSEIPQLFTIQIMTITGKVVREIDVDELGGIHIGRNITTYAWDGRDQYGDQLANGVYLYRVITRLDGESIEHRDSGADQYITHGWGKMYLMR